MARILVVEDEPDIAMALQDDLSADGHAVETAGDGDTAFRRGREEPWDLILLDVMLPRKDGFEVCRDLRRDGIVVPIILLTARTQEAERLQGFDLGADDYVTKPFSPRELRARVKAVLRRAAGDAPETCRFGEVEVDFARCEMRRAGNLIDATATELKLIALFVRRRGRVLTRETILEEIWGSKAAVTDRAVDAHIVNLRRKVERDPANPRHVVSIRGFGYRFDG